MPPADEGSTAAEADESLTTSAETRWAWLATAVVGLTVFTFLLLVSLAVLGVVSLSAISGTWATLLGVAVASSYAYALGEAYIRRRDGGG